jgi:hypothetical protein
MRRDWTKVLFRADRIEVCKHVVTQFSESDCDTVRLKSAGQNAKRRSRSGVDVRDDRTVNYDGLQAGWSGFCHVSYPSPDVIGIEVEPAARAAHNQRAGRIAGIGISLPVYKATRGWLTS